MTHILENIIFNERMIRECAVDIGIVYGKEKNAKGKVIPVARELDFLGTSGGKKTYAYRYNAPFAARAYVKIGSSRYYGSCRTASLAAAAQSIKQTGGDAYTQHQAYIDNILAQADAVPEA